MTFQEAISAGFQKYATFSGRALRSEFWWWTLFSTLVSVAASAIDFAIFRGMVVGGVDVSPFHTVVSLGLLLPSLAVLARRLHDLDRTAWWILIIFTGIGVILLIVWCCFRGTDGPNRFGPPPASAPAY